MHSLFFSYSHKDESLRDQLEVQLSMLKHQGHNAGDARVISVILRPCEWQKAPLGKRLVTATDGKPVTKWTDRDDAFLDVAKAIRSAAESAPGKARPATRTSVPAQSLPPASPGSAPRSSNLRNSTRKIPSSYGRAVINGID